MRRVAVLDKAKVAAATVQVLDAEGHRGQGVVVPGQLIVTAAHVITWDVTGGMALGDHYCEDIEIGGQRIRAEVYAAEPVSDIAVLGIPDDPGPIAKAFEASLQPIVPVPICTADWPLEKPFPVHIRTHTGGWIAGQACQYGHVLWIDAEEAIEGGTSGGPVVTADGQLLGVASFAGDRELTIPRVHLTAPGWLLRRMLDPGERERP